jgi:hypothetical protein
MYGEDIKGCFFETRRWNAGHRAGDIELLAGPDEEGHGQVIEEEKEVAQSLQDYYRKVPQYAKYVGIGLDTAGLPVYTDCERASQKMVVVRIDLTQPIYRVSG